MKYKYVLPHHQHNIKLEELENLMDKNNIKITNSVSGGLGIIIDNVEYQLYDIDMEHSIWELPRQCESDVLRVVEKD